MALLDTICILTKYLSLGVDPVIDFLALVR